jgi:hypothetical protein
MPHPGQCVPVKGHRNMVSQGAAEELSLIEASLASSFAIKRYRNNKVEFLPCPAGEECRRHQRSQKPAQIPTPVKLEALHDAAQFQGMLFSGIRTLVWESATRTPGFSDAQFERPLPAGVAYTAILLPGKRGRTDQTGLGEKQIQDCIRETSREGRRPVTACRNERMGGQLRLPGRTACRLSLPAALSPAALDIGGNDVPKGQPRAVSVGWDYHNGCRRRKYWRRSAPGLR